MIPALLIAGNFVREQRWSLVGLTIIALILALGFAGVSPMLITEDVSAYLTQQAIYAVGFSLMLAASAINNERRSRRILAVLSKAVSRAQYLAGLLLGIWLTAAIYCVAIALACDWMMSKVPGVEAQTGLMVLQLWMACALTSAVAMFFSTFLPPFGTMIASASLLSFPVALAAVFGKMYATVLPSYMLAEGAVQSAIGGVPGAPLAALAGMAASEAVIFWLLGATIFGQRDIAAAIE